MRTPILLLPGASATGRDYLLEKLLANLDLIGRSLGLSEPLRMKVAPKTTTRPSRTVELLKRCVSADEFQAGLSSGQIIAPYILESNGHHYGYHRDALSGNDADLYVTDASVYQIPHLKREMGNDVHAVAMIATREYRETNLNARGSESPEEKLNRLNLGDGHVALAILMSGRNDISLSEYVNTELADMVEALLQATRQGTKVPELEKGIEAFTKSRNVVDMLIQLADADAPTMDELAILTDEHRTDGSVPITETKFFDLGVSMIRNALGKRQLAA